MEQTSKALVKFWANEAAKYIREVEGMKIDPLPELILLGNEEQKNSKSDLLISTGGYNPTTSQIFLYIDNRHLKDIIRSYCHELVHHMQNLDNHDYLMRVFTQPEDLVDNPQLEEIEGEAYLKGNLLFRKFTEWLKNSIKEKIHDNR